jgi:REP element-mobilizing transposase RayT
MSFHRRRLPHWVPDQAIVFVTWRLAGSPAPKFPAGERFESGPLWLRDPRIANMLANSLVYGEAVRRFYCLHASVIMPNHVHAVIEPRTSMPAVMRWLKGRTGRVANRMLERVGAPFWQDESFDHWVRTPEELRYLIGYVEDNPVNAGLVASRELWLWSSGADHRFLWSADATEERQTTKNDRLPHRDGGVE